MSPADVSVSQITLMPTVDISHFERRLRSQVDISLSPITLSSAMNISPRFSNKVKVSGGRTEYVNYSF